MRSYSNEAQALAKTNRKDSAAEVQDTATKLNDRVSRIQNEYAPMSASETAAYIREHTHEVR